MEVNYRHEDCADSVHHFGAFKVNQLRPMSSCFRSTRHAILQGLDHCDAIEIVMSQESNNEFKGEYEVGIHDTKY
jgi:hypothetical protein